jgi:hypothetical protein
MGYFFLPLPLAETLIPFLLVETVNFFVAKMAIVVISLRFVLHMRKCPTGRVAERCYLHST